tara:strand:- start:40 stop:249 length:210 start_codon:yes stop_codon:yes gene_type:complete
MHGKRWIGEKFLFGGLMVPVRDVGDNNEERKQGLNCFWSIQSIVEMVFDEKALICSVDQGFGPQSVSGV